MADRRREFRDAAVRRLLAFGVLLAGCAIAPAPVPAQAPDNRGIEVNPEDSVSEAYGATVGERDRSRLEQARREGGSYVPTLIGPGEAPDLPADAEEPEALAGRPARLVPSLGTRPRAVYENYGGETAREDRPAAGDGIPELMDVLLEAWSRPPGIVRVRYPAAAAPGDGGASGDGRRDAVPFPLPGAGVGLYARTLYTVDSDFPGPVLLEILEPPLDGATASGSFALAGERMVLRLDSVEYGGRRAAVEAWAVDPGCACYGVAGEVDRHFFERVLLPAAVRFAEGFLTAISRPAESLAFGSGDMRYERRRATTRAAVGAGLGTAARAAGDILTENAPTGPTVRIPRNSELVVVFAGPPRGSGFRVAGAPEGPSDE